MTEDPSAEPCPRHARKLGGLSSRPGREAWRAMRSRLFAELSDFVRASEGHTMVYSSEALYARLDMQDIRRFAILMDQLEIDVDIGGFPAQSAGHAPRRSRTLRRGQQENSFRSEGRVDRIETHVAGRRATLTGRSSNTLPTI
jgi:hypothetical protein